MVVKQFLTYIYCDESCHLEHDHQQNMVLGAIACSKYQTSKANKDIREIKRRHGMTGREIKWGKVSPAKVDFYAELIIYFFENNSLRFRGLVASKNNLDHCSFAQTHNDWYYKMYYHLLSGLINRQSTFHIFLDIKDTCGSQRRTKLKQVLCNTHYDFDADLIRDIQAIHSNEVELVQLTDLLVGCVMYANRPIEQRLSTAKLSLVGLVKERSRYTLINSTPLGETKFNLFHWQPQQGIA